MQIQTPGNFHENRYAVVRSALSRDLVNFCSAFMDLHFSQRKYTKNVTTAKGALDAYGLAFSNTLLHVCQPVIAEVTGLDLLPCYSYSRIYLKGNELVKHTDRPGSEIGVTIPVSRGSEQNWAIHIEDSAGETLAINLDPGDFLVYGGMEIKHWRYPLEQRQHRQIFLFYVDRDGPHRGHHFDAIRKHDPVAYEKIVRRLGYEFGGNVQERN